MACAAVGLEETPRFVVDFTPRTPGSIDEKQTASELLRLLCLSPLLNASPNLCVTETTPVASSLILDRVQYHSRPVFTASATLPAACIPNRQSPHLRICHSLLDLCQPPATLDLSIGPCHRVCIFPFVASSSPHSCFRPGRAPLLSFLASVTLDTIITLAQKTNTNTSQGTTSSPPIEHLQHPPHHYCELLTVGTTDRPTSPTHLD
ncbi:hypothetical protein SNOG_04975 [Parastagonospora nodorum SN15]|uniref:Uncharacterized protein n=1 Tax=Phaeosphaeria nodorum (strain SN15 / ATCC MYA-4574 / FGSC 10173) TaxID=321614 RepID=Q0UTD9_PHANO|nr:hypothetical protein SNOG_04975 [Parastagonospora nodorum SN15]EAT87366.1 hypothetical protein SNOG_04975 [Parastagonospora nodorum SN15]